MTLFIKTQQLIRTLTGSRGDTNTTKPKKHGTTPGGCHVTDLSLKQGRVGVLEHHSECIYTDLWIWVSGFS